MADPSTINVELLNAVKAVTEKAEKDKQRRLASKEKRSAYMRAYRNKVPSPELTPEEAQRIVEEAKHKNREAVKKHYANQTPEQKTARLEKNKNYARKKAEEFKRLVAIVEEAKRNGLL